MTTYTILYHILGAAALYYLCPLSFRPAVLLIYSMALYASGGKQALFFILITILSTYTAARMIGRIAVQGKKQIKEADSAEKKRIKQKVRSRQRAILFLTLILNFGILVILKYIPGMPGFVLNQAFSLAGRSAPAVRLFVPLGISFFIFQSAGYLIDVYNGKYSPEKNLFHYALFVSFFPQLIQGPIGRYDHLSAQLKEPHRLEISNIRNGLMLILWGFFKKKVIADRAFDLIETVFSDYTPYGGAVIVIAVLFYSLQQYADFSGGIDLVTGSAEMMGIHLAPNFRRPYFSVSLGDFWRRWHISLGSWMRDYVFYPFALTRPMQKLSKAVRKTAGVEAARALPAAIGNILVFLLVGLWHGAEGNYIAWGLYNGLILAVSALLESSYKRFGVRHAALVKSRSFYVFRVLRTFIIVNIGWYFDRAIRLSDAFSMLGRTLIMPRFSQLFDGTLLSLGINAADYAILGCALLVLVTVSVMQERGIHVRQWMMQRPLLVRWTLLYALLFFTMFCYVPSSGAGFIYAAF